MLTPSKGWFNPGSRRAKLPTRVFTRRFVRMARNYEDAIAALNSLQSNFAIVNAIRQAGPNMNLRAIPEMIEWCQKIGYQPSELNRLNLIHIAGTKGKGSTCAFISSILSQYLPSASVSPRLADSQRPKISKVGLYTSPHLRFIRERIQINNEPISEQQFANYFFEIWDRLEASAKAGGMDPVDPVSKPSYFRYLTLMAFHAYMCEGVDAAIIECGIGGEYDSTNVIDKPVVTGITSLGIDHQSTLGNTIEEIAWHKAGIMKKGVPAFTAPQIENARAVLEKRAVEKGAELHVATGHPELTPNNQAALRLGLSGEFQYSNASLAVAVAGSFLRSRGFQDIPPNLNSVPLPDKFKRGLKTTKLGGRCEMRLEKNIAWYIDGAHTLESIEATGKWFVSQQPRATESPASPLSSSTNSIPRILIFNQQTRDSVGLARALHNTLSLSSANLTFTHAIFCTNVTFKQSGYRPDLVSLNTSASDVETLKVQGALAQAWKELSPSTEVLAKATIEEAVDVVREIGKAREQECEGVREATISALVTGSLHLVGGLLEVLETTSSN
ncbi:folylpolyglutamate synthase [Histoplasma capsulatum var. duboisii H88]|uniref:Folylpolyglutamate synthase n=3 Tax=Ajellomyces capsulatus TaxID=5037 RepID=A0A8A1LKT7_AJEC8|nr:folylpolyglutamate synthase [Histoplasma capsulatum var. duboisii H88]